MSVMARNEELEKSVIHLKKKVEELEKKNQELENQFSADLAAKEYDTHDDEGDNEIYRCYWKARSNIIERRRTASKVNSRPCAKTWRS